MKSTFVTKTAIAMLLIFAAAALNAVFAGDPTKRLAIHINGHQLPSIAESVEITARGFLTLNNLAASYAESEKVRFKVVIRRTHEVESMPILNFDVRFEDGKTFDILELEKLMIKTRVGDTILIIPVDPDGRFENSKIPISFKVIGDRC